MDHHTMDINHIADHKLLTNRTLASMDEFYKSVDCFTSIEIIKIMKI